MGGRGGRPGRWTTAAAAVSRLVGTVHGPERREAQPFLLLLTRAQVQKWWLGPLPRPCLQAHPVIRILGLSLRWVWGLW